MQIFIFAAIIIAGWYMFRKFVNDAKKLNAKTRAEAREKQTGAQGTLVYDPKSGEYRVKQGDDES